MALLGGKIVPGLGVGSEIIKDYLTIFKRELKMDIFPGTLNLQLEKDFDAERPKPTSSVSNHTSASTIYWDGYIQPFTKPDGTKRGGVWYLRAKVKNFPIFVIRPELTRHPKNIIEIISPINIRKQYGLKDGDFLEVNIL